MVVVNNVVIVVMFLILLVFGVQFLTEAVTCDDPSKDYHMKNYGVFLYRDPNIAPGRPLVRHVSGRSFLSTEERISRGWPAERPLISRRVKQDLTKDTKKLKDYLADPT